MMDGWRVMMRDEASKMTIVVGSLLFYVWVVLRGTPGPFWNRSEVNTLHQLKNSDLEHLTPKMLVYEGGSNKTSKSVHF